MVLEIAESDAVKHIWIFRKGNGQASVFPSPAILKGDRTFTIVNKTTFTATISFPAGVVDPREVSIPRGESRPARTLGDVSAYFEYDVSLGASGAGAEPPFYAEGGSKPSIIIER